MVCVIYSVIPCQSMLVLVHQSELQNVRVKGRANVSREEDNRYANTSNANIFEPYNCL